MKLNPTYSSGDINFIHDEAQIFVESIINNLDDNITPILGDDGRYHYVYLIVNKTNGFFYIGKRSVTHHKCRKANKVYVTSSETRLKHNLKYYYGSGSNIKKAIKTEGKTNFLKFVIKFCKSSKEGFDLENRLADEETLKQFFHIQCMYNIQTGGNSPKYLPNTRPNIGKSHDKSIWLIKNENSIKVKKSQVLKYLLDGYLPKAVKINLYKIENQKFKKTTAFLEKTKNYRLWSISDLINALTNGWKIGDKRNIEVKKLLANQLIDQPQPLQPSQPVQAPQPLQPSQPVQAPQPLQPIKQGRPRKPTFQFEASLFDWQDKII
jgi:hypothetical protein